MKILSWDVGISHLAFWFGELNKDKTLKTIDWNNINLIPDHQCKSCKKKAIYQKDNDYSCEKHKTIGRWKKIPNCKTSDIDLLRITLINILDTYPQFLEAEQILIENQPSLKNPKMKAISCCLGDYFIIRGIVDKKTVKNVNYISPLNKLKISDENLLKNPKVLELKETIKDKYKLTKNLGILYAELMLKEKECWKFLDIHKKKDDCIDSILQMYNFVTKNYGTCTFI